MAERKFDYENISTIYNEMKKITGSAGDTDSIAGILDKIDKDVHESVGVEEEAIFGDLANQLLLDWENSSSNFGGFVDNFNNWSTLIAQSAGKYSEFENKVKGLKADNPLGMTSKGMISNYIESSTYNSYYNNTIDEYNSSLKAVPPIYALTGAEYVDTGTKANQWKTTLWHGAEEVLAVFSVWGGAKGLKDGVTGLKNFFFAKDTVSTVANTLDTAGAAKSLVGNADETGSAAKSLVGNLDDTGSAAKSLAGNLDDAGSAAKGVAGNLDDAGTSLKSAADKYVQAENALNEGNAAFKAGTITEQELGNLETARDAARTAVKELGGNTDEILSSSKAYTQAEAALNEGNAAFKAGTITEQQLGSLETARDAARSTYTNSVSGTKTVTSTVSKSDALNIPFDDATSGVKDIHDYTYRGNYETNRLYYGKDIADQMEAIYNRGLSSLNAASSNAPVGTPIKDRFANYVLRPEQLDEAAMLGVSPSEYAASIGGRQVAAQTIQAAGNSIKGVGNNFTSTLKDAGNSISSNLKNTANTLKDASQQVIPAIKDSGRAFGNALANGMENASTNPFVTNGAALALNTMGSNN
ncbi:MAG TPA: hypothetical protein DCE23_00070 [Firmicutes bacterium]|nr:hypothetical protein [Bacillota bacterium]